MLTVVLWSRVNKYQCIPRVDPAFELSASEQGVVHGLLQVASAPALLLSSNMLPLIRRLRIIALREVHNEQRSKSRAVEVTNRMIDLHLDKVEPDFK